MSCTSDPQAETSPPCACCAGETERMARRLAVLQDLTEAGMEIVAALRVEAQALSRGEAEPGARGSGDLALTFSRVARAVRQTLALEARLVREHHEAVRAAQASPRAPAPPPAQVQLPPERLDRRYEICRVVDEAIEAEIADVHESEALFDVLSERLDDEADRPDFMDRPLGAIIAEISQALGLQPDWSLWADEDWAREEARVRAPGSPYANPVEGPDLAGATRPPDPGATPGLPRCDASP